MGGGTTKYYGDGGVKIGRGGGDSPDSGCCFSVAPSSLTGNTSPAAGLEVEDEEVSGRRVAEKEQQAVMMIPPRRRKVVIIRRPQTKGHEEHSLQVACPKIAVFHEEKEEALKKPVLLERCFVSRPPFSALADNPSHFLPKSLQEAVAMVEEGEGENEAEPARKRCRPNRRGGCQFL
jgi:hypothetical protein